MGRWAVLGCCSGSFGAAGRRLRQRLWFAPGLAVISRNGRVVLWERRDVSYSLRTGRRCYDRHTKFERADVVEMRRDVVVARALVDEADVAESGDRAVISRRGPIAERGYRVEGRLYVDGAGRPVLEGDRTFWVDRRPARPGYERRYGYPARLDLGRPPGPRCKPADWHPPRSRGGTPLPSSVTSPFGGVSPE